MSPDKVPARMGAYDFNFDLPPGETYAPSPDRVRALEAIMPRDPFSFAPVVTDRAAWDPWRADAFGQRVLKAARDLAAQPFPEYTDAAFLDCLARQDFTQINTVIPLTRRRQVAFLLAEAIYDRGEFLEVIGDDARRLARLRTWIHPGSDLKRLNYDGKTVEPDLGVCHFAANLAQTDAVLGPRLPADLRALIREQTNRRVFQPLRQRLETGRDLYWWIKVRHNWNAVTLSCCAEAAAALLPSAYDRAWWLAVVESLLLNSRDGYNDDGVCVEGMVYWGYGFMFYASFSELLRLATGDVIDQFDELKMARAARFPDHVEIQPGVFPTYADCGLDPQPLRWARLWLDNRLVAAAPGATEPAGVDPFASMGLQYAVEPLMWMFRTREPRRPRRAALSPALRSWFEVSSLLVCRPGPATRRRLSALLKGGNNGTNHHHNDLGTFTVVLDGRTLVVDPGTEVYSFRTFSSHRYDSQLLNSYGHPVPRVAGRLQETGPERRTRLLASEFTDETDRIVFDLRMAYDVPGLLRLEREFLFDRRGDGAVTVTDRVEFSAPAAFESALISLGRFAHDGWRGRLSDGPAALAVEMSCDGAPLEIVTDTIDQPPHPTRIALRCRGDVRQATVRVVLRPA